MKPYFDTHSGGLLLVVATLAWSRRRGRLR